MKASQLVLTKNLTFQIKNTFKCTAWYAHADNGHQVMGLLTLGNDLTLISIAEKCSQVTKFKIGQNWPL